MIRPRIKSIRERLALWVAPWLVRPFARGGVVNNVVFTQTTPPGDPHVWSRRLVTELRATDGYEEEPG